ncbi:MAG: hypothetical protein FWC11_04840, partial [Firmicutes bacterium]|nr:hypothetical protein [Bacillota bacterium]
QGEKGETGPQGEQGTQGEQGPPGEPAPIPPEKPLPITNMKISEDSLIWDSGASRFRIYHTIFGVELLVGITTFSDILLTDIPTNIDSIKIVPMDSGGTPIRSLTKNLIIEEDLEGEYQIERLEFFENQIRFESDAQLFAIAYELDFGSATNILPLGTTSTRALTVTQIPTNITSLHINPIKFGFDQATKTLTRSLGKPLQIIIERINTAQLNIDFSLNQETKNLEWTEVPNADFRVYYLDGSDYGLALETRNPRISVENIPTNADGLRVFTARGEIRFDSDENILSFIETEIAEITIQRQDLMPLRGDIQVDSTENYIQFLNVEHVESFQIRVLHDYNVMFSQLVTETYFSLWHIWHLARNANRFQIIANVNSIEFDKQNNALIFLEREFAELEIEHFDGEEFDVEFGINVASDQTNHLEWTKRAVREIHAYADGVRFAILLHEFGASSLPLAEVPHNAESLRLLAYINSASFDRGNNTLTFVETEEVTIPIASPAGYISNLRLEGNQLHWDSEGTVSIFFDDRLDHNSTWGAIALTIIPVNTNSITLRTPLNEVENFTFNSQTNTLNRPRSNSVVNISVVLGTNLDSAYDSFEFSHTAIENSGTRILTPASTTRVEFIDEENIARHDTFMENIWVSNLENWEATQIRITPKKFSMTSNVITISSGTTVSVNIERTTDSSIQFNYVVVEGIYLNWTGATPNVFIAAWQKNSDGEELNFNQGFSRNFSIEWILAQNPIAIIAVPRTISSHSNNENLTITITSGDPVVINL